MDWRHRGVWLLAVAMLCVLGRPAVALAMYADVRYEAQASTWRGIQAKAWVYNWVLGDENGEHVSSIYIHHPDYEGGNVQHMELGIDCAMTVGRKVFYQWCKNPYDWNDWRYQAVSNNLPSGAYQTLEINNVDRGSPPDNWVLAWNGTVVQRVYHPLAWGQAWASSERWNMADNAGDDSESSFRDLKKRDNNGNWFLWINSQNRLDQDPFYTWGSYSASHWYTYDPGRP